MLLLISLTISHSKEKKKRSEIISREHTHALDLPVSIDPLESDLEAF